MPCCRCPGSLTLERHPSLSPSIGRQLSRVEASWAGGGKASRLPQGTSPRKPIFPVPPLWLQDRGFKSSREGASLPTPHTQCPPLSTTSHG